MHIMNQLFAQLKKSGIQYAHFKSNVNLDYSFNNVGDFDVVMDPAKQREIYDILLSLNAKQMKTPFYKCYPGVDNWLLFDTESGRIHHLHLHYQLMSGKKYVKEYEIPWREEILNTRIYDKKWNLYISDPNMELLLLSVRCVIKSRVFDTLKACFGMYKTHNSLNQERNALLERIDESKIEKYIKQLFEEKYWESLKKIMTKKTLGSKDFLKLSKIVRKQLSSYRRMNGLKAWWYSILHSVNFYYVRLKKKIGYGDFNIQKKTSLSKGAIFAFVGVDGAGKSTTAKEMYKWLSKQIECNRIYMGMGDGNTNFLITMLKKARKIAGGSQVTGSESINSKNYIKKDPVLFKNNPKFFIRKLLLISAIYSVEKKNNKKMIQMNKYRINGGISILDRYPQIELPNVNDGPKIAAYKQIIRADKIIDKMIKKEKEQMAIVKTVKPDIIFRLNITAEESMKRKKDQSDISIVQGKIDDLESIKFQETKIIDIDASQPYEKELIEIKKIIWNFL